MVTRYKYGRKERFFIDWGVSRIGIDGYRVLDTETRVGNLIVFRRPVFEGILRKYRGKQGSRWACGTESGIYIHAPNASGRAHDPKNRDESVFYTLLWLRDKRSQKKL